ncbi:MAG: 3-phosphoshikimate 1-carboxyvinyltransferase [Solirubrobacteraceae bacterium]|nr:3-phosphoshikimate 1-carboxyvinyltransferase [Solirubrobacteraceae bacterium]
MSRVRFDPAPPLKGSITAPPDKSISHRAALFAAMSEDPVSIVNYLDAGDTNSTLDAIRALGVLIEQRADELVVRGGGMRSVQELDAPIDVGNAGTLMRLLPGWLAGQEGASWTLDGDASIRRRPVDRIAEPLRLMGAEVDAREGRFPPFTVRGARLRGIEYELASASAQVKSCVLIAGVVADGETAVITPSATRDHTERMLKAAGVDVRCVDRRASVGNVDELELERVVVPGDMSSAAFLVAAGVLVPGSRLVVENVGTNWTRAGFLRIADRMGAVVVGDLEQEPRELPAEEPVSDLDVRAGPLVATDVAPEEVPLAIDELPLVALMGCFAEGETVVRGAHELRLKETDRITAVVEGLRGLGAEIEAGDDGFAVTGTGGLNGGVFDAHGDHRLAMMGAVAGLASREGVEVIGMDAATISYPDFLDDMRALEALA